MTVNSGATLVIDDGAFAVQIGSLAGAGSVVIGPNNPVFLDIGGGKQTTFEGSITGNGDLTIINPGTHLTLTGISSISGFLTLCNCTDGGLTVSGGDVTIGLGIVVEAGTLTVSNGGKLTQVDSGPGISIDSAMVVTGAGSSVTAAGPTNLGSVTPGSLTIQNGGTFNSNGGVTIGLFGVSGTQATVTGDGSTWNIDNGLFVNNGASLTVADGGLVNVTGAPPMIASGGTLNIGDGGRAGTFQAASLGLDGQLIANFTDTATLAFNIAGDGSVTNNGPGKLTLAGTNQYNGGTFFNAGTISVGSDASLGSSSAALNFNGGQLQVTGTAFTSTARTINWGANGGGFDIADAANIFTLSQDLSGGGPLTKAGPGTLVVTGTNTYSGGTTIREGTLRIDDGGTIGAGDILINGTLAINKSASFTLSNNSSGTGGLNQLGSGTTTLTGTNTYAGATNVVSGTLRAGAVNTFSPNSTHHVAAGATLDLNNFAQVIGALSGAGNVLLSANLTAGGNNASTTFSGQMTGSGALTKTGAGTLVLSGANNYTGGTTLAQGTLRVEHNQALGSGALTTTGSVLDYANAVTLANPIVIGSDTTQLNVGSGTATQAGAISETGGARPLEKTGAGTLVLAGANSYTGATSVSAGRCRRAPPTCSRRRARSRWLRARHSTSRVSTRPSARSPAPARSNSAPRCSRPAETTPARPSWGSCPAAAA